jgi:hypothetical protein
LHAPGDVLTAESGITNTFDIITSVAVWSAIKHILRPVEVLSTVRAELLPAVEADKASLEGRVVIIADLFEDTALVELGKIALEIEFAQLLNIGCILRSPSTGVFSVPTAWFLLAKLCAWLHSMFRRSVVG